jgi:hypothetical protein
MNVNTSIKKSGIQNENRFKNRLGIAPVKVHGGKWKALAL